MDESVILAIDPGKTNGLALYVEGEFTWRGQVDSLWKLNEVIYNSAPDYIVCERFDLRHMGADLSPVEAIGVVKMVAEDSNIDVFWQAPQQAKKSFTNDKLKALDLYLPGMPHAMDATRHLLWHISFTLKDDRYVRALASHSA